MTLTGEAGTGYVLAGWIGCKKASGTACTVEMTQAREVTAVFLAEAKLGSPGPPAATARKAKSGWKG